MEKLTFIQFQEGIKIFLEIHGRKFSEESLREYFDIISFNLSRDEFNVIRSQLLVESKYFPTPASWLELAKKTATDAGKKIWKEILYTAAHTNFSARLAYPKAYANFPDNVAASLLSIGGFPRINSATEAQLIEIEREFLRQYQASLYQKKSPQIEENGKPHNKLPKEKNNKDSVIV